MEMDLIKNDKILVDGETLTVYLQDKPVRFFDSDTHIYLTVFNKEKELVADSLFGIKNNENCFIVDLEVKDIRYDNKGVESQMLSFIEEQANLAKCKYIYGIFYAPENEEYQRAQYEKEGYIVNTETKINYSNGMISLVVQKGSDNKLYIYDGEFLNSLK